MTPAPRHEGAFASLARHRVPSLNEADVSDKPLWVQSLPLLSPSQWRALRDFRIGQYETLLAVDEAVKKIVDALEETGRLSNTMIVFTSDNGYTWGEHRWRGKITAYEESIRVPFLVRYDQLIASPRADARLVANIDIAPTIAELAGVAAPGAEGQSLVPLFVSPDAPWRQEFLVEHYGGRQIPPYCAVRSERFTYVTYATGEEELYDLLIDLYQRDNSIGDPAYQPTIDALRVRLQELCQPVPPDFSFFYDVLSPSVPTALTATALGPTQIDLAWAASTDNVAVTGYTIYRDGAFLATVDATTTYTTYSDTTVLPATTYTYTVDAFDAAQNHSAQSDPATATTPGMPKVYWRIPSKAR